MTKYNSLYCDISKNACSTVISEIYNSCFRYFWDREVKTNEFTDVVEIENLEKFMFDKFRIKPKRYNVSMKRLITISDLTQEHINDIKNIYKEDYQIPKKFADKLYK